LRIVGGEEAKFAENPWQVALVIRAEPSNARAQFCGGSIITPEWIITAAHCVDGGTVAGVVAVLTGTADLRTGGIRHNVAKIYVHDGWEPATHEHDVAMLQLMGAVSETPVGLPATADAPLPAGAEVRMTGWGRVREGGKPTKLLQQVVAPIQEMTRCNDSESYGGKVKGDMFCAGRVTGGIDTCQGDSGGPATLAMPSGGRVLVGLTSWGEGCGKPKKYGIYSRVAAHLEWIRTVIAEN
jgi:secreted trypsin-like serine protease